AQRAEPKLLVADRLKTFFQVFLALEMREDFGVLITERRQSFDRARLKFRRLKWFDSCSRRLDHPDDGDNAEERPEDGRVPSKLFQPRNGRVQGREGPLNRVEKEEKERQINNEIDRNLQRAPFLVPGDLFGGPINGLVVAITGFVVEGFGGFKIEWHMSVV